MFFEHIAKEVFTFSSKLNCDSFSWSRNEHLLRIFKQEYPTSHFGNSVSMVNYLKLDNDLYLLNVFILNLPARNKENIVPATLNKTASSIKQRCTET